jgi:hypothetical protein
MEAFLIAKLAEQLKSHFLGAEINYIFCLVAKYSNLG